MRGLFSLYLVTSNLFRGYLHGVSGHLILIRLGFV